MQAIVIDVYDSEAYLSLQDGRCICVGLAHLPSNIKTGSNVNIHVDAAQNMINHKLNFSVL
jgi:hypothetical protein